MLFLRMVINILFVPAITLYIVMTVNKNDIKLSGKVMLDYGYAALLIFCVSGLITRYLNNDCGMQLTINSSYYTLLAISVSVLAAFCFILITRVVRTNKRVLITVSIVLALLVVGLNVYSYIRYMPLDFNGIPVNSGDDEMVERTDNKPRNDPEVQTVGVVEETGDDTLYVIFTIDTEDNRGHEPYLIEGDLSEYGIEENCGVDYIMDTFAKYNANAVFFVNIYEHNLYEEDYMPELLRRIDNRGNEVALHAHVPSDKSMPFFTKDLPDYTLDEQCIVYDYGRQYIYNAIGKYPTAYRAGAYRANDDTLLALARCGFRIDSSLFSNHKNSEISGGKLHNQVFLRDGIIEFPVVDVFNGKRWIKLDLDWMTYDEIIRTLEDCRQSNQYNCVQLMFHSFSFIDTKENTENKLLVADGNKKIYGENQENKNKLKTLLEYLSYSDEYRIITFNDYLKMGLVTPKYDDNNFIYLDNEELAFRNADICVGLNEDNDVIILQNSFVSERNIEYRFIFEDDNNQIVYDSGWNSTNEMCVPVTALNNGLFTIKCCVRSGNSESCSSCYIVDVNNGRVDDIRKN